MANQRLFIGNLAAKVQEKHILKQFSGYGQISNLEIKDKKDWEGNCISRFAYLNLDTSPADLNDCLSNLDGYELKGSAIKVTYARESFLERLKRERESLKKGGDYSETPPTGSNFADETPPTKRGFPKDSHDFNSYSERPQQKFQNEDLNFKNDYSEDNYYNKKKFKNNDYYSNENFKQRSYQNSNYDPKEMFQGFLKKQNEPKSSKEGELRNYEKGPKGKRLKLSNDPPSGPNIPEDAGTFVNLSKDGESEPSTFSLLDTFDKLKVEGETQEQEQQDNFSEELSHDESSRMWGRGSPPPTRRNPPPHRGRGRNPNTYQQRPQRPFFSTEIDADIEHAISWLTTPLTEERKKEFEEIRRDLINANCKKQKRPTFKPDTKKGGKEFLRKNFKK